LRWLNLRNMMKIRLFFYVTKVTSQRRGGCITIAPLTIFFTDVPRGADEADDLSFTQALA